MPPSEESKTEHLVQACPPALEVCTNCHHVEPHTGPAGAVDDACTHPGCHCGFDSRGNEIQACPPAEEPHGWQPIETAPKDGSLIIVRTDTREGLPAFATVCRWHPDAGWCVDELREVTHWMPLPALPPAVPAPEHEK